MKKRILSFFLCLLLITSLLPAIALAEENTTTSYAVYVYGGTVSDGSETIPYGGNVPSGNVVTVTLDESAFSGHTFDCWIGSDGTKVPEKSFRILVEQTTAFYPVFTDLTGSFGPWTVLEKGPLCTDGTLYVREDAATGLKEYKFEEDYHDFSGDFVKVDDEQHKIVCTKCGYEERSSHYWNSGTVTTEPTHTSEGVKTYTCYSCNATKTEPIEKTSDHAYGEWVIDTEAKDGNPGLRHRTCACGDTQTGYYIKAEWEQYLKDLYLQFDRTCRSNTAFGNTQDEWFYAYKNSDGLDTYVYVIKQDTGDTATYGFMYIDDPSLTKKPVYVARLRNGSSYHSMYSWALHCYVKNTEEYFSLMAHLDQVFGVDNHSGTYSSTMLYMFGFWEDIYNAGNREDPDWWQDSYTREEVEYLGFDCWSYTSKDTSNPKVYYVIKDSNVCIYHYNPVSTDGYILKEIRDVKYNVDFSGMTEEEKSAWYLSHYDAADIGTTGSPGRFSKDKPAAVSGYRVAVRHDSQSGLLLGNEYEWSGYSDLDERNRLYTVFSYGKELSDFTSSDSGRSFRLTPLSGTYYDNRYIFDHWEKYNFDTEAWEFYSNEQQIKHNYVLVENNVPEDHRINDIQYFRGVYSDKLYHVKVDGGYFTYNGQQMSEGDVPYETVISLTYDSQAVPDGYYFDHFEDAAGNELSYRDYSSISVTSDLTYTAVYEESTVSDPTYYVNAYAENGSVTMGGKTFYGGSFPEGETLTLSTVGNEGYTTFLGWFTINYGGKGKGDPEYVLLSTETTLQYTVNDHADLIARWSDGTTVTEPYHDIISTNGLLRDGYGYAVSAVRTGKEGDIFLVMDSSKMISVTSWTVTGTDYTYEAPAEKDGSGYLWIETGHPTKLTVTGIGKEVCTNHTYDEGQILIEATHLTEGTMLLTCTRCGFEKTEPIQKLPDHTWGPWVSVSDSKHQHSCACGETEDALHHFDNGSVTTEASITQEGVKTYTCTDCDYKRTESIPKLPYPVNTDNVTSTEDNTTITVSESNVEAVEIPSDILPTAGTDTTFTVSLSDTSVTFNASASDVIQSGAGTGEDTSLELRLEETDTEALNENQQTAANDLDAENPIYLSFQLIAKSNGREWPVFTQAETYGTDSEALVTVAYPHDVNDEIICYWLKDDGTMEQVEIVDSTSSAETVTIRLSHFSYYVLASVPSPGHTHSYGSNWRSDDSKHWKECSCTDRIEEAAHTLSDWITDTAATATTDGTKHKECTVCHRVMETGTIPATGSGIHTHSYGSAWRSNSTNHWKECSCGHQTELAAHSFTWITDAQATATAKGLKHEECTVCGYQKAAVEIPATGSTTNTTQTSPETGYPEDISQTENTSHMILWIILVLALGFGVTGAVVYGKGKNVTK